MYTPEERAVLEALSQMYDQEGDLLRNDARDACGMVGQAALDVFHALETAGILQFNEDGHLNFMPGDEHFMTNTSRK